MDKDKAQEMINVGEEFLANKEPTTQAERDAIIRKILILFKGAFAGFLDLVAIANQMEKELKEKKEQE